MPKTRSAANIASAPHVTIHEVMFHPAEGSHEYVVLHNAGTNNVDLFSGLGPWRLRGDVDFDFAPGLVMTAGSYLCLLPFDPTNAVELAAFESVYGAVEMAVGPYRGSLGNRTGHIALQSETLPGSWLVEDEVFYFDRNPWPDSADGTGLALHRLPNQYAGSDPAAWRSGLPSIPDGERAWPMVNLVIDSAAMLRFNAFSNLTYVLEWTPSLMPPSWSELQRFADPGAIEHFDFSAGVETARYYRVRISE
jgi:hypothetical protein